MDQNYYVYILFDFLGIPRYVGKGCGNRWVVSCKVEIVNKRKNWFIRRTLEKIGQIPCVVVRDNLTVAEAFETEKAFVKALGRQVTKTGSLTNLTNGGNGFSGPHRLESRAKTSAALMGRAHSEDHKRKVSEAQRGKPKVWTEEGRARFLASQTGRPGHHTGHSHSEETKEKLRIARSQQIFTPESRSRMGWPSGRQHSDEARERMKQSWIKRKEKKMLVTLSQES